MNFKNGAGAQAASSATQGAQGNSAPGGNMLSGILGGPNYAEKNPMQGEISDVPKLDAGNTTDVGNKPALDIAPTPPRLELSSTDKPDTLQPVGGEKPKTIIDEDYKTARQHGFVSGQQWLTENAKAAQRGERDPLTMDEIMEVYRDDSLDETLDERTKREKRENLGKAFSTFGNIAANAANFAFATQGGIPGDYNNRAATEREKEIRDRRQALKEKYDNIIMQAKGDEIAYARDLSAAREKQASAKEIKEAELAHRQRELDYKTKKDEDARTRQAFLDEDNRRKTDAQIKKWESDAKTGSQRANAYSASVNNKKSGLGKKDEKYKAAFTGKNGTYRFKDSDVASSVASSAISMLKDLASKRGDDDTMETIKDVLASPNSSSAAMEFMRQRMGAYPEVEAYIADKAKEFNADTPSSGEKKLGLGLGGKKEKKLGIGLGK